MRNCGYTVTQEPGHEELKINGVSSVIVDTPGYKDSQNRDNLHFNNLEQYLYGCGGVDAFLLIMNGTKNRFDKNIQEMLKEFGKYFGSNFWRHLIMIFTRIEGFEQERYVDEEREDALRKNMKDLINDIDDDCDLPIITIGFGQDYGSFCKNVMNHVIGISNKNSKLNCQHILSPIKALRKEKESLETAIENVQAEIDPLQQKVNSLNSAINTLKNKLANPEKYPLLSNYNGTI